MRAEHLDQARAVARVVAVSNRYAVDFGRVNDELLERLRRAGDRVRPVFRADRRRPRGEAGWRRDDAVTEVARAHGATAAQVRLAWALSRGPHVLVIPGTGE